MKCPFRRVLTAFYRGKKVGQEEIRRRKVIQRGPMKSTENARSWHRWTNDIHAKKVGQWGIRRRKVIQREPMKSTENARSWHRWTNNIHAEGGGVGQCVMALILHIRVGEGPGTCPQVGVYICIHMTYSYNRQKYQFVLNDLRYKSDVTVTRVFFLFGKN